MCFLLLLPVTAIIGQVNSLILKGRVQNESSLEPLSGVAILEAASGIGTTTNEQGAFSLEIKIFPAQVCFQYLGYFGDTLRIKNKEQFKQFFEGHQSIVTLRQNPFLIKEVVISAKEYATKLFGNDPYSIIDYIVQGNRFYALGYRNYNPLKPEIFIGNDYGKMLYSLLLPGTKEIYQDCKGDLYAVSKNKVYHLINQVDSLVMEPVCDADFFYEKVKPIVSLNDPFYIYYDQSKNCRFIDYYSGNYSTNRKEPFIVSEMKAMNWGLSVRINSSGMNSLMNLANHIFPVVNYEPCMKGSTIWYRACILSTNR